MQEGNEAGLAFYKKFGFEIIETIPDYYTDIEPKGCYILKLILWKKKIKIFLFKKKKKIFK